MAKQLNVNLAFTADTGKAKAQLQDLQNTLNSLVMNKNSNLGLTNDIMKATQAAAQLKVQLESATNPNTGLLDLSKFNESLNKSGISLKTYQTQLSALGPAGQQAFSQLAQSITTAEIPLRRTGALVSSLWTTMKNTMRWQISSSIFHGLISGFSTAYRYAEDLNESLNNIRIVTGYSTDQMAKFAAEANKAAKILSTTTTEYTNASLIYYQQGLSDSEVQKRTDITIKMANVARESAEVVSDQMTAVWNNFYDGSKSLEYYADVMTALGAATASSTDEIAEGLEKFAAIAESVGLSYEYATSALATVTATTRQSADVVGTAFKTLFARIQDLELGETLDDGVTLGKYSEALNVVGVNILDANNNLREMDDILDDLGARWDTITQAEKVSVAQTVAGVRQYTQLIALMDNWDYFQENLNTAMTSEGTLQSQADIYAESWEAASNRVTASAEAIYEALLDDEFFIGLLNFGAEVLDTIDNVIDSLGGFKGVMLALGAIITRVFQQQIAGAISNMAYSIRMFTKTGEKEIINRKREVNDALISTSIKGKSMADQNATIAYQQQGQQQQAYLQNAKNLNAEEQKTIQLLMDRNRLLGESVIKAGEAADKARQTANATERAVSAEITANVSNADKDEWKNRIADIRNYGEQLGRVNSLYKIFESSLNDGSQPADLKILKQNLIEIEANLKKDNISFEEAFGSKVGIKIEAIIQKLKSTDNMTEELAQEIKKLYSGQDGWSRLDTSVEVFEQSLADLRQELNDAGIKSEQIEQIIRRLRGSFVTAGESSTDAAVQVANFKTSVQGVITTIQGASNATIAMSATITQIGMGFMNLGMIITSLSSIFKTLNNEEATTEEKITAILTGVGMLIPALMTSKDLITGLNAKVTIFNKNVALGGKLGLLTKGKLLIIIAALVALAAAITAVVKIIKNAYNVDSDTLKSAKEQAKEAKEAFDEAKQSFEDLKNSLTQYNEMQTALSELTEGTKEWNEKLKESNLHITEMLRNFPELSEYFKNDNGIYSFTDTEAIEKLYESQKNTAESALNTAKVSELISANRSAKTDALRDKNIADAYNGGDWVNEISTMAVAGAVIGEAFGNPLTIAAGVVAGAALGLGQAISNNTKAAEESEQALVLLQKAYDSGNTAIFTHEDQFKAALEGISSETVDALWKNKDALESLTRETNANTLQMQALLETNVANVNANNPFYQALKQEDKSLMNFIAADRAKTILADTESKEYQDLRKQVENEFDSSNYDAYLTARFGKDKDNYRVVDTSGSRATLEKKNEEGTWERVGKENGLTDEDVITYMMSHYAQTISDKDKNTLNELQKIGSVFDDIKNVDSKQILNFQKDLYAGKGVSLLEFSPEQVEEMGRILDEQGHNFAQAYVEATKTAIAAYDENDYYNNVIKTEAANIKNIFSVASKELDVTDDALESYSAALMEAEGKTIDLSNATLKERAEQAKLAKAYAKATVAQYKLAQGINKVQDVFEKNKQVLKGANKESLDFHQAVGELTQAMEEAFGMEINAEFVKQNLTDIQLMTEGNIDALNRLKKKLNEEYIFNLQLEDKNLNQALLDEINRLQDEALNKPIETELRIKEEKAIEALNKALYTGQATIEDIEAMFNNANLAMPEYKTKELPGDVTTSTSTVTGKLFGAIPFSYTTTAKTTTNRVVPYFGDQEPTVSKDGQSVTDFGGGSVTTTSTGITKNNLDDVINYTGNNKSSSSKGSRAELTQFDDRYKTIDQNLDRIDRKASKVNKELDKMYGASRIGQMDALIDLEEAEIEQLEEKKRLAEDYLKTDENNLNLAASKAGVQFSIDSNGYITNYESAMQGLYGQLNALELQQQSLYDKGADTSAIDAKITVLKEKINLVENALDQYNGTLEVIEETEEKIDESNDKILEWNYKTITTKVELKLEINDSDIKRVERKIAALGDDLFSRAEAASLMTGYVDEYEDALQIYEEYAGELKTAYEAGKISQADYIEGLKEVQQGYFDNIDALREYKKAMKDYYGDTLQAGDSEFQKYMKFMEHPTKVMEHYDNILDLTGGEKDYAAKAVIYQGVEETRKYQAETKKAYYDMMKAEADTQKQQMEALDPSSAAYEYAKAEWEAAQELADQAQLDMLDSIEEWAQAVKDVLTNAMASAIDQLEKDLTNGLGFDKLTTLMNQSKGSQEEWLTTTNKIYETNKLISTAQQEIDKTTNKAAKNKLQTFITQTQKLQDQNKLSKFELEIQQARYNLLAAEIALEESKNAKSTVRLQRDSDGNFGYVYTADESKIAEAQQAYNDAENALYNVGLEGYNKYTEQYLSLQKEHLEEIDKVNKYYASIGEEGSEEHLQALEDLNIYYGGRLADVAYLSNAGLMAQSYEQFDEFKTGWFKKENAFFLEEDGDATKHYSDLIGYAQGFNLDQAEQNTIFQEGWATTFGAITGYGVSWKNGLVQGEDGIFNQVNSGIGGMRTEAQTWAEALCGADGEGGYLGTIRGAFAIYQSDITAINGAVGLSMSGSDTSVANRAEALTKIIGDEKSGLIGTTKNYKALLEGDNGLIKKLENLYYNTDLATQKFQGQLQPIEDLETKYEDLAWDIQDNINKLNDLNLITLSDKSYTVTEYREVKTIGGSGNGNSGGTQNAGTTITPGGNTQPDSSNTSEKWMFRLSDKNNNATRYDSSCVYNSSNEALSAGQNYIVQNMPELRLFTRVDTYKQGSIPAKVSAPSTGNSSVTSNTLSVGDTAKVNDPSHYYTYSRGAFIPQTAYSYSTLGLSGAITQKVTQNGTTYYAISSNGLIKWFPESALTKMATGGYTGTWGPEGKIAMLHEKELVLNQDDTVNFLSAIGMLRDIAHMIDLQALQNQFTSMMTPMFSSYGVGDVLEQMVQIEAHFPNVTSHSEIEEAFKNLVNISSQYANRKI